jgi:hypothetical protein
LSDSEAQVLIEDGQVREANAAVIVEVGERKGR